MKFYELLYFFWHKSDGIPLKTDAVTLSFTGNGIFTQYSTNMSWGMKRYNQSISINRILKTQK